MSAHPHDRRQPPPTLLDPPAVVRRAADRFAPMLDAMDAGTLAGMMLMLAAAAALIVANSPAVGWYERFLGSVIAISVNDVGLDWSLHQWVNDGLMSLFFLLVGLEIRRELVHGDLAGVGRLAAPAAGALGGILVPVGIYLAFAWRDPVMLNGWGIPMATDIAFSLAVLRALGTRVPIALKLFLTALAILDDLGAILAIGLFYTSHLHLWALSASASVWVLLFLLGRTGFRPLPPYLIGGVVLWYLVARSGVHPTIAGVALAFAVPMRARGATHRYRAPAEVLEIHLQDWVAFLILPLFGFANAGLRLRELPPGALSDALLPAVGLGLFVGKQLGVFCATWLAVKAGWAKLPGRMTTAHLYGVSVLCGIGFTMSLFITDLALRDDPRESEARLAVLVASILSALVGLAVLRLVTPKGSIERPAAPVES